MKRPSLQFYPGDWISNPNLRRCTFEERGVWISVICLLHDQEVYGLIRWPLVDIAQAVGCVVEHLHSLVRKGVLKGSDEYLESPFIYIPRSGRKDGDPVTLVPEQPGPVWFSSRMIRDEHVRHRRGYETRFVTNGRKDRAPKSPIRDDLDAHPTFTQVDARLDGAGVHRTTDTSESPGLLKNEAEVSPKSAFGDGVGSVIGGGKGDGSSSSASIRKKSTPSALVDLECPADVRPDTWRDWKSLRKAKKAPVTPTVVSRARCEAEKAGLSFDDFLGIWCVRGSQGLEASWLKPEERGTHRTDEMRRRPFLNDDHIFTRGGA